MIVDRAQHVCQTELQMLQQIYFILMRDSEELCVPLAKTDRL